jgi:hypothetical protein
MAVWLLSEGALWIEWGAGAGRYGLSEPGDGITSPGEGMNVKRSTGISGIGFIWLDWWAKG